MSYIRRSLIALDRAWNTLLGGNRDGETISSAVGRKAAQGRRWAVVAEGVIDAWFAALFGERHHCANNIERKPT